MPLTDSSLPQIEQLYREYSGPLLLFAIAICNESSRAHDAIHQVFLKLMETGNLIKAVDIRAYLFASVRNELFNHQKHQRKTAPMETEAMWFEPPDRDYAAEVNLRRALQALPDDQRQVVLLHVWGELTFLQVAEVIGISANTVASRYRYALAKLRDAMSVKENSNG